MRFAQCEKCKEYGWFKSNPTEVFHILQEHKCKEKYFIETTGGMDGSIRADNHEDAANKWAEKRDRDSNDYTFADGSDDIITVTNQNKISKNFKMHVKHILSYEAEEI